MLNNYKIPILLNDCELHALFEQRIRTKYFKNKIPIILGFILGICNILLQLFTFISCIGAIQEKLISFGIIAYLIITALWGIINTMLALITIFNTYLYQTLDTYFKFIAIAFTILVIGAEMGLFYVGQNNLIFAGLYNYVNVFGRLDAFLGVHCLVQIFVYLLTLYFYSSGNKSNHYHALISKSGVARSTVW